MTEEELRQLKLALVSAASSALQCDSAELQQRLWDLSAAVAPHCPEFPLQVALYTRRHLALRSVSCFLLAAAAILAPCRPHLRRYFGAVVRLPSDWVAVPRFFQGPRRRRRGCRRRLAPQRRVAPQDSLPPSLFTLRSLVRRLHICEPRENVAALLGRRMVTSDPRPRLPPPNTWERALSAGGVARIPRAVTWQRLIDSAQLPMLALLRNLRAVIQAGLRPETLQCIVGRLRDPEAVRRSQVPPSQWLRAMEALLRAGPERARCSHRTPWKLRRRRHRFVSPPAQLMEALSRAALKAAAALPQIPAAPWILMGAGGGTKTKEAMALVALLGRSLALGAELRLCGRDQAKAPPLPPLGPMGLLGAVRALRQEMEAMEEGGDVSDVIWELVESGREVSVLLLLCPTLPPPDITEPLRFLRSRRTHSVTLVIVTARPTAVPWEPRSDSFLLAGFNESVLRFVAEGDAAAMLARVEAGPAHYGLAPPTAPPPARDTALTPPPPLPVIGRWRTVRLFVSSTFADMAAERDALVRAALPRLRAMAAPHGVGLSEVDLRWGVEDPDPRRQVELCLEEVTRSDVIVGVLGERYGARAPNPPPQGFPPGRSVTELELRMFLQRWSSAPGPAPALIYIRDPAFLQAVPEELRGIYGAESEEAAAKMAALKEELKGNPAVGAVRSYRCSWGPDGPTALEDFVAQVVADVWDVLQRHFLHGAPPSVQDSFLAAQLALGPVARSRLVAATATAIRRGDGNRLLLTGEPGVGRTVFMAALIGALQQAPPPSATKPLPPCLVAYHFASARPDQSDARVALAQLCTRLEELLGKSGHASSEGSTYQELRPRLLALLTTPPPKGRRLVLLIDDAHFLHVGGTERSDWLPPAVHPRVSLVLSVPANTSPAHFPEVGGAWTPLPLRPLPPPERADLLGAELRRWGRSFERRYVSAVLGKGGAKLPLYQRLLLAELRAFARYEDLPEVLLSAPPTVPALLQRILHRLAARHGPALALSLAALSAAPYGLEEAQLLQLLGAELRLRGGAKVTWEETLRALEGAKMAAELWGLLRDLRWLLEACGAPLDTPGSRLYLAGSRLAEAVQTFLGAGPKGRPTHGHAPSGGRDVMATARMLLAGLTLRAADPLADGHFRGAELEHLALLPRLLAEAELWGPLWDLICGVGFLRAHGDRGAVGLLAHGARLLVPAQLCGVFHAVGLPSLLRTLDAAVGLMEELRSVGQEELLPIEPPHSPTSVEPEEPLVGQEPPMGQKEPPLGKEESLVVQKEPHVGLEEPLVGQKEPLVGQEDPLIALGEPLVGREALLVGLAQVVANSAPQCPLRPHSRHLLPHSGHRLLLGPTEDALTHKWQRRLAVSPRCVSHWFPLVAVGSAQGRVKLLEAGSGQEVQEVPATCGAVTAVGFISSDRIAVGGAGGGVELWELKEGRRLWTAVGHSGAVTALQGQNGNLVSCAMDGGVAVWSLCPSPPLHRWMLGAPLLALASHPKGALLAAAGWAEKVVLLSREREKRFRDLPSPRRRPISALCWDPDGTRLVAAQVGGALLVWAWPEGDALWAGSAEAPPLVLGYPGGHVTAVAFAPPTAVGEGPSVVTSGPGGKVLQWPSHRGRLHALLPAPSGDPEEGSHDLQEGSRDPGPALCVTFDPWGSRLAVGHHGGVSAVHGAPWGSAPRLCHSSGPITCLAWVGGTVLAGAGPDGVLWGWELPGPAHLKPRPLWHRPLERGAVLALSATANGIAVSTEDGALLLFPLQALLPHSAMGPKGGGRILYPHLGSTTALSFCPTETRLATGGRDRAVAVWGASGAAMGQELQRWENAHREWVCAVGWAGALLLSGSADGVLLLWDVAVGQRLRELVGLQSSPCAVGGHGRSLLAVGRCGSLWVWSRSGRPQSRHRCRAGSPTSASIAPSGAPRAAVAVSGSDGSTWLWQPCEAAPPRAMGWHSEKCVGLVVSGGHTVSVSEGGDVREWNTGDTTTVSPTPPSSATFPGAVVTLGWHPEGTMVLAGGPGGQLSLWGDNGVVARGTCPPPPISAVTFGDPRRVLVAAGRHLEEWELRGGPRLLRLRRHPALPRPIVGFCRGLRGGPVLILLGDGQLWLWGGGTPPRPLRATVSPTPLDPKDLRHLYGDGRDAHGVDGNGDDAHGVADNGVDGDGVEVTPYRLPGCPVAVRALPGGGFLLWGGMEKLHLCHLRPHGAAFMAAVTAVPLPPLSPHGPTQWFTGAEWHHDFGLFLTRSDGSMWVCPSWGRGDPQSQRWHRRKVSQQGALLGRLGAALLTSSRDGSVRVWHPRGGAPLSHYRCSAPITAMAPRPHPSPNAAPGLAVGDEGGRVYILRWDTPLA